LCRHSGCQPFQRAAFGAGPDGQFGEPVSLHGDGEWPAKKPAYLPASCPWAPYSSYLRGRRRAASRAPYPPDESSSTEPVAIRLVTLDGDYGGHFVDRRGRMWRAHSHAPHLGSGCLSLARARLSAPRRYENFLAIRPKVYLRQDFISGASLSGFGSLVRRRRHSLGSSRSERISDLSADPPPSLSIS
jgi:hypothetical protein